MARPSSPTRLAPAAAALSLSLLLHGAAPWVHRDALPPPPPEAVEVAVEWVAPPEPADEEPPAPEPEQSAPPPEPEPEPLSEPERTEPPEPEPEPEKAPEPSPAEPDEAPAPEEPPEPESGTAPPPPESEPAEPPPAAEPPVPEAAEMAEAPRRVRIAKRGLARKKLLERAKDRAERRRLLRERRAQIRAKALARKRAQARGRGERGRGEKKGKRPVPAALKKGRPDEVWACEAESRGVKAQVLEEEPITSWITMVPTVMFTFPTEPGLTGWMDGVARIRKRSKRYVGRQGPVELALPASPIEVTFEEPGGVTATLGRHDARCLVGFRWNGKKLWPLTVFRVPAFVEDSSGHRFRALVNVTFHEDATFAIAPFDGGGSLPVSRGRLAGGDGIENAIAGHVGVAKSAQKIASWFGLDLRKMTRDKKRAKRAQKEILAIQERNRRRHSTEAVRARQAEEKEEEEKAEQRRRRRERAERGRSRRRPTRASPR